MQHPVTPTAAESRSPTPTAIKAQNLGPLDRSLILLKPPLEWAERRPISIRPQAAMVHLRVRSIEPTWPRVAVGARICSRRGGGSDFSREL